MGFESDTKGLLTKEKILETVVYCMVNREANTEVLEEVPHIRLLDVAGVSLSLAGLENGCTMGLLVGRETCRHYGIQDGELEEAARRNTEAMGFTVQDAGEALGIQGDRFPESMYVLTNRESLYGASIMLYEDYFLRLAERAGTDLYILPASIHELIAVPAVNGELAGLQNIVKEINGTEEAISPGEVLSNNVYWYSREGGLTYAVVTSDTKRR